MLVVRQLGVPYPMTMSCSYARPSTSIDPNPRNRTSITCHRTSQRHAPRHLLPDKLAALDPAQRRGVAVVLRHVAGTFAEVPDGKHTAHTLSLNPWMGR